MEKRIDVLIPTYRPDKTFEKLMDRLHRQTMRPGKIIIVNTGEQYWEEGGFDQKLSGYEEKYGIGLQIAHILESEYDHGGTRKRMAAMSDAEILLFMTQDAVPADRNLIETIQKCFEEDEEGKVAAAYARQLPASDCQYIERYTRQFNYPSVSKVKSIEDLEELGIKTFFCSNVCAAYRKDVFEKEGGFVDHTIFNEDMIYAGGLIRKGYKIAYLAEARVIHSHNYNGRQQFKRNFDLAVSQTDHPEIFSQVKSEKEGIRLVLSTAGFLCKRGKPFQMPRLIINSGCKYLGYKMGRMYKKLPEFIIMMCTSNKNYWK